MGRYRTINVDLNRQYRNDLNKNFEDIEKDIFGAESDIAKVEAESKERDNLIAGTDVEAVIERIDSSATNAELQSVYAKNQGDYAKTQGDYAKTQGDYTKSKGDYANEKAILADQAAANANTESSNLSQLKINVTTAAQNANTATNNANTATTNANNSATYATEQGDYAKQEADRVAGMDVGQITTKVNQHLDESKMSTIIKLNLNQSIPNNILTPVNFNNGWVTNYNSANYAEIVNGKVRLTKGVYRIDLAFYYNSTTTPVGVRTIDIENIDRYFSIKENAMQNSSQAVPLLGTLELHVTDSFKDLDLLTYQTSGNPLNLLALSTVVIKKVGVL